MKGREVQSISDFFRQDDVFVGIGLNETLSATDAQDIFEELYPDSPYAKNVHRNWERQKKKRHAERNKVDVLKDHEPDKRDSGFGESTDGSNSNRESDQELGYGRKSKVPEESASTSPQPKELIPKIDQDRGNATYEETERSKKRQAKMVESERRALEEEKRKRGLVALKPRDDPLKRMKDREKERIDARKRKENERRKLQEIEEEKVRQRLEEAKARRQKELEEAEAAARLRQIAAEKAEQEKLQEAAVDVKVDDTNAESDKPENVKTEKSKIVSPANVEEESVVDKVEEKTKDKERETDKENEKPPARKRTKLKIVRKTKAERQVDGDDYVLSRYDLGRTLGDGNFAIVRQSKSKITGQEFAMKVIDKHKLKGKEHMVENEIDIMKDCNHQNIVKLYEEYETTDKIYLVMELVKVGNSIAHYGAWKITLL